MLPFQISYDPGGVIGESTFIQECRKGTRVNTNYIEDWFRRYFQVFSTQDLESILPHYHTPMIVVVPGGVIGINSEDDLRSTFSLILSQYSLAGYGRSEVLELDSRSLGQDLAEVGGIAARYDSDGGELNRFEFRYVMRHDGSDWRIAAMVNGDPIPPSS